MPRPTSTWHHLVQCQRAVASESSPSFVGGFKWGGSGGGSGPKTHWGACLLNKIMILQGVKLTIQPLAVGYVNTPKKAQNGGYVVFSPTYARLGSNNLYEVISIFELPRPENCMSRLYPRPLGSPPPPPPHTHTPE